MKMRITLSFRSCCSLVLLSLGCVFAAAAKDASTAAIVLYDGPQGAAYVQLTAFNLNGKTEVRDCEGVPKFDKKAYNALPRGTLQGATSLQRGQDGVLTLMVNGKPVCIVPSNLKFDKKPELTPAEAADQAVIQGVAYAGAAGIPPLQPGVQVVFVAAPDVELAEFLRAQRGNTIPDWKDFLTRYPSSAHRNDARVALAGLHERAAEDAFAQYQKSIATGEPKLAALRQAYAEAQLASQVSAGYKPAAKLIDGINTEFDRLMAPDRAHLQAFQKALQDHSTGYGQLVTARVDLQQLMEVRSEYAPLVELNQAVAAQERKLDIAVASADALKGLGRYDDAINTLGAYNSFTTEVPRIDAILNAAYRYHFDNGQRLASQQEWERAAAEFRKAAAIRPDSKEAAAALNNATVQLAAKRDQEEARLALVQSNDYASKGQFVEAYNILADLPDPQRALVSEQLTALAHNYVAAAIKRAQKLQELHVPIKDRTDEDAVREAYVLLDRASSISGDPAITLKRDFLSSKISAYYFDRSTRYLEKPSGSGAGVGWLYLNEAKRYAVTNADSLNDQMAKYAGLYQRRGRISVGIVLRDQTSRLNNPGFSDQLADAIASGLESSGLGIEVVRNPAEAGDAFQPKFMLVGEVLEHRVIKTENLEAPESKYRAAAHETKNPAWLQAQSDYQSAQQQLTAAQQTLSDAQTQHKKKDVIATDNDAVTQAQKRADELRHTLDTTDQNQLQTIVEPYHYTKKTVDLNASIELTGRITDRSGNVIGQAIDIHRTSHKTALVVQGVKAEDTEGVTNQGVEPDETQFLTDLEIETRDVLVKTVRGEAAELPSAFLAEARTRAQQGDLDGAAEAYIIYLNAVPESTPGKDEAAQFLHDRFDLAAPVSRSSAPVTAVTSTPTPQ